MSDGFLLPQTRVALLKKEDECKSLCLPFDFEQEAMRLNQFSQNAGYTKDEQTALEAGLFALNLKRSHTGEYSADTPPIKRSNSPTQQPTQATTTKLPSGALMHGRDGIGYTIGNPNRGRDMRRNMDPQKRSYSQSPLRNQSGQGRTQNMQQSQQRPMLRANRSSSQPSSYQLYSQYQNRPNNIYPQRMPQTQDKHNTSQNRDYQRQNQGRYQSPNRQYYNTQNQNRYYDQNQTQYQGQGQRYDRDNYQNRNFDRRDQQYGRGSSRGNPYRGRGHYERQGNYNYRDNRPYRHNNQQSSSSTNVSGNKIVDIRTSITNNPERIKNTFTISQMCNKRACYNSNAHSYDNCPIANKPRQNQNF